MRGNPAALGLNGGLPARRAVIRWAWRLFRREWRQQALVLALLTIAVAAAIGFASAAYNTTGVSENAVFGTANHLYEVEAPDEVALTKAIAAAEERFGRVGVIARWSLPIPGSVDSIEFRSQDSAGALTEPMLALVGGRYPGHEGEVAITDGVAQTLTLATGDTLELGGTARRVVGIVENPSDLNSEFALVAPEDVGSATSVTMLVKGSGAFEEVAELRDFGDEHLQNAEITSRSGNEHVAAIAAASVLGLAAQSLLLVSLVAAAGFIAVAHRRLRQVGMLGAIGATERHLRLVVIGNGAVIGVVAALVGAALGLAGWIAVAPRVERAVGYRIDAFNVPWWLVSGAMVLVFVAAVGAAWWPARSMARIPITLALSGRPSPQRPVRHSLVLACALIAIGTASLVLSERTNAALVVLGTAATGVGVLLLSPLAVQALGRVGTWLPVAQRLALRDLARHQARSGFALAAISFTLAMPVANVVTASAEEHSAGLGNISERQLLVWTRDPSQPEGVSPLYTKDPSDSGFSPYLPRLTESERVELQGHVESISAELKASRTEGLDLAVDPAVEETPDGRLAVTIAQRTDIGYLDVAPVFVATPTLLHPYGLDLTTVESDAEVITVPPSGALPDNVRAAIEGPEMWFGNVAGGDGEVAPQPITTIRPIEPGYTSLPASFITPEALSQRGWESVRVGWLIESGAPITSRQLTKARVIAADAGLLIESRRDEPNPSALHWRATVISMLVALGVLAMTVGLIRNEGSGDLRTLTATGATGRVRRALTAATAAGLALFGALLGAIGAYLVIAASYVRELSALGSVPIAHLGTIAVGVPISAAVAGWLVAGREPALMSRQPIE